MEKISIDSLNSKIKSYQNEAKSDIELNGHTNHPAYDNAITQKLQQITESSLSQEQKFEAVKSLINKTKTKLENEVLLGTKDVNNIIDL